MGGSPTRFLKGEIETMAIKLVELKQLGKETNETIISTRK